MAVDETRGGKRECGRGVMQFMIGMKGILRNISGMLAAICILACFGTACAETGLEDYRVRHGDRESRKIAITMDDVYEREWVWKAAELCREYGITMTFFPIGCNLQEEDRENWQEVLDTGCEIGNHTSWHDSIKDKTTQEILYALLTFQESLDRTLGYHYEVRWFRPPYGNIENSDGSSWGNMQILRKIGYGHILLWDVSWVRNPETNQLDPAGTLRRTQNGSILLFHAREADYTVLEELIPMLLEAGYEPVTVSELFGYDPPETGDEMFVYDPRTYKYPETTKD